LYYAASFLSSITTPSLVDIIVFSLVIDVDNAIICFSNLKSRYADTATG